MTAAGDEAGVLLKIMTAASVCGRHWLIQNSTVSVSCCWTAAVAYVSSLLREAAIKVPLRHYYLNQAGAP